MKYLLLFLLIIPCPLMAQTNSDALTDLVDEAWKAVNDNYFDITFNGLDWERVRRDHTVHAYSDREEAYAAIRSMLDLLENPATRFLEPAQAENILTEFAGQAHEGVGLLELLSVDTDLESGDKVIVTPVPGGPAARAGLRPGDVIEAVAGEPVRPIRLADLMTRLRGEAGSTVHLTIRRGETSFDVDLQRESIPAIEPVDGRVKELGDAKIGYLRLRQFTAEAPERLREMLERQEEEGVNGFVLDLRNNPGGNVDVLQRIAGFFLGETTIAYLKGREEQPAPLESEGERLTERPVAVLINEGSASAAEALAAALRYPGGASVIGMPSFGKGLAHGFVQLSDGSAVMPTSGRLLTPEGRDILEEGIRPDILVKIPRSPVIDPSTDTVSPEDRQFHRAAELLPDPASGPSHDRN